MIVNYRIMIVNYLFMKPQSFSLAQFTPLVQYSRSREAEPWPVSAVLRSVIYSLSCKAESQAGVSPKRIIRIFW
jgi:hypothetical protein